MVGRAALDGSGFSSRSGQPRSDGRRARARRRRPTAGPGPTARPPQHAAPAQGDGFAGITGDLVDGRFSEKEAKAIANQNSKLLRVRLGEPFMARQGSMVAYQGNVDFSFEGGGASKFIKKALTGEGLPLMRCQGQGDVFLAERPSTCIC